MANENHDQNQPEGCIFKLRRDKFTVVQNTRQLFEDINKLCKLLDCFFKDFPTKPRRLPADYKSYPEFICQSPPQIHRYCYLKSRGIYYLVYELQDGKFGISSSNGTVLLMHENLRWAF